MLPNTGNHFLDYFPLQNQIPIFQFLYGNSLSPTFIFTRNSIYIEPNAALAESLKLSDLHQAKYLILKRRKLDFFWALICREIKLQLITKAVTNMRKQPKVNDFHQAK